MEVEPSNQQEGRFKLKEWNAVVMWSWNTDVDTCAICRSKLMTLCIDCQAKVNSGEKGDCQVVFDYTSLCLGCMGYMWSCFPCSLYQSMVTDEKRMPS